MENEELMSQHRVARRDFALFTAGVGLALGLAPAAALARPQTPEPVLRAEPSPAMADPYSLVDREVRPALEQFPTMELTAEMVGQFRQFPVLPPLPAPAPQPVERRIPGSDGASGGSGATGASGASDVRLWIVDPAPLEKGKPVLLHMHGGGFMMPDPMLQPRIQGIATDCECVVVSVDYRLAPETRYPGALEDNYAALKWVHAHAAELGIDRSRIAVGGESAGGGHAASLALHARKRKEVPIVFQLLLYPQLDDRTGSTHPASPAIGNFIWNAKSNRLAWSSLLGVPAGSSQVPAAAVPARAASVAGLPPTWIGVGAIDLFVEEDMEYARRLVQAGVATELLVVPGGFHGFDVLAPDAEISKRFTASWKRALREAFASR